jgi:hypothetical protein
VKPGGGEKALRKAAASPSTDVEIEIPDCPIEIV